jgi:ERCC4-type nuclease
MSFSLKIDYRENRGSDIISAISKLRENSAIVSPDCYDVVVESLTVGDFILYCGRYVYIIERKTLADLASSIADKRIYRNHDKLLIASAELTEMTARVMYLIEGDRNTPPNKTFGNIAFSSLVAKLDHIALLDGCAIDWTNDCASRLLELGKNMLSLLKKSKNYVPVSEVSANDGVAVDGGATVAIDSAVKKSFTKPVEQVRLDMLCCVKSVGRKTAEKLLATNKLSDILAGNGNLDCVSEKIRDEIFAVCAGDRPACTRAMLLEIKGVSTKIADLILLNTTMSALATNYTINDLAGLKNEGGRKVGKALAERIITTIR